LLSFAFLLVAVLATSSPVCQLDSEDIFVWKMIDLMPMHACQNSCMLIVEDTPFINVVDVLGYVFSTCH